MTTGAATTLQVAFPPTAAATDQDAETVWVHTEQQWREIRLHDYAEIFAVPGLYERIFSETLDCDSPRVVTDHLVSVLADHDYDLTDMTGLDLGAGNGMVGEQLAARGITDLVGLDRIPEAAAAARRDRPGIYRDYLVGDITTPDLGAAAHSVGANLLICVAALGFGDIPVAAFDEAVHALRAGSWVAFNIKTEFLAGGDPAGFTDHLAEQVMYGELTIIDETSYIHRRARSGAPLRYTSIIARTPGPCPRKAGTPATHNT